MLRLLKIRIPNANRHEVVKRLGDLDLVEYWLEQEPDGGGFTVELLVSSDKTEPVVEVFEGAYSSEEGFRLVSLDVEATVPHPEAEEDEEETDEKEEGSEQESAAPPINIEELYNDVTAGLDVDWKFVAMALLSAVVASIGVIRNDVAVVIAAMIIAPLLTPNMALSLATTLADRELAWKALLVNAVGLGLSMVVAVAFGLLYPIDATVSQIALRTKLGFLEIGLAGSAGAAGALSFTSGDSTKVVGVMVAVALLPPVVVFGMLLGATHWQAALGAFFLTAANIVCLNLAGVVTFLLRRIRPRTAWEAKEAESASRRAIAVWVVLLVILVLIVYFGGPIRRYP